MDSRRGITATALCGLRIIRILQKAIAREKQLKGWRREKKTALIEKMNPAWVDLSKDWYDLEPADFKRATDRMLS
jgi:predicted GIY-YIG superfamily endonuclease